MVLKSFYLLSFFITCGCLVQPAVLRVGRETKVAVAYVLDLEDGIALPPANLARLVAGELEKRDLPSVKIPLEAHLREELGKSRETVPRVARLFSLAEDAPWLLLVEARAVFFSQLGGRQRWTVYAKATLSTQQAIPARVLSRELELSAVLDHDHEREEDALAAVAPLVAKEVGALIDSFVAGEAL